MSWWQWALSIIGGYLGIGFVISVIYVRWDWKKKLRYDHPDNYDLVDAASFIWLLWPLVFLMEGVPWLFGLLGPLFRLIYTPAAVRKARK